MFKANIMLDPYLPLDFLINPTAIFTGGRLEADWFIEIFQSQLYKIRDYLKGA
jgi:hypothetical protein